MKGKNARLHYRNNTGTNYLNVDVRNVINTYVNNSSKLHHNYTGRRRIIRLQKMNVEEIPITCTSYFSKKNESKVNSYARRTQVMYTFYTGFV